MNKCLIITPSKEFPGGVETMNKALENILQKKGFTVQYLTADGEGCPGTVLRLARFFGLYIITAYKYKFWTRREFDLVIANGEYGFLIGHKCGIVVFHGGYSALRKYTSEFLTLKQKIKFWLYGVVQRASVRNMTVVTVSEFMEKELRNDKIRVDGVIKNPVNTQVFRKLNKGRNGRCLFVGSGGFYSKGCDLIQEIHLHGLDIDYVSNERVFKDLRWLGKKPHSVMPLIYNSYTCLLFPSRFESSGLVALEAMACGLPVLMGKVGIGEELQKMIPEFIVKDATVGGYLRHYDKVMSHWSYYSELARKYVVVNHSIEEFENDWATLLDKKLYRY